MVLVVFKAINKTQDYLEMFRNEIGVESMEKWVLIPVLNPYVPEYIGTLPYSFDTQVPNGHPYSYKLY